MAPVAHVARQGELVAEAGGMAEQPAPAVAAHPCQHVLRGRAAHPLPRGAVIQLVHPFPARHVRLLVRCLFRPTGQRLFARRAVDVSSVRGAVQARPTRHSQRAEVEIRPGRRERRGVGQTGARIAQHMQLGHRAGGARKFGPYLARGHGAILVRQGGVHRLDVRRDVAEHVAPRQRRRHRQDRARHRQRQEMGFKGVPALFGDATAEVVFQMGRAGAVQVCGRPRRVLSRPRGIT